MCKPPALQLELVRQLQWEIHSAALPIVCVGETAPGQGESRRVLLAWRQGCTVPLGSY